MNYNIISLSVSTSDIVHSQLSYRWPTISSVWLVTQSSLWQNQIIFFVVLEEQFWLNRLVEYVFCFSFYRVKNYSYTTVIFSLSSAAYSKVYPKISRGWSSHSRRETKLPLINIIELSMSKISFKTCKHLQKYTQQIKPVMEGCSKCCCSVRMFLFLLADARLLQVCYLCEDSLLAQFCWL